MFIRYSVVSPLQEIKQNFELWEETLLLPSLTNPNVGPGEFAPVIAQGDKKLIQMFRFGMPGVDQLPVYNLRAEGNRNQDDAWHYKGIRDIVNGKYRQHMLHKRCAIICDAFIVGHDTSAPYLVYPRDKQRPFLLAGIWNETFDNKTGEFVKSFAMITIFGNPLMNMIGQSRSPVILDKRNARYWLSGDNNSLGVSADLMPFDAKLYNAYPISKEVSNQNNKSISIIKPTGPKLLEEYHERAARQSNEFSVKNNQARADKNEWRQEQYRKHDSRLRDQGLTE